MRKTSFMFVILVAVLILSSCKGADSDLTDYSMTISTFVTLEGKEDVKQSAIEQTVRVNSRGEEDMLYDVKTVATSTDMTTGDIVSEENSYMFYNDCYYYTYPGVRYKSPTKYDMALENIENLTDVITFEERDMLNAEWTESDEGERVEYQVDYKDTSPFVRGVLENAAATFDGLEFSPKDMSAAAIYEEDKVVARELFVCYEAMTGERIAVEIYVDYKNAEILEKPDEDKYVNIMAQ